MKQDRVNIRLKRSIVSYPGTRVTMSRLPDQYETRNVNCAASSSLPLKAGLSYCLLVACLPLKCAPWKQRNMMFYNLLSKTNRAVHHIPYPSRFFAALFGVSFLAHTLTKNCRLQKKTLNKIRLSPATRTLTPRPSSRFPSSWLTPSRQRSRGKRTPSSAVSDDAARRPSWRECCR